MKKNILKKLINKALKEELKNPKKLVTEAKSGCRCKYKNTTTGQTGVTNIGSSCKPCTEACCKKAGYVGIADDYVGGKKGGDEEGGHDIDIKTRGRNSMPSVPTMPHGGGFGPGGIPTKPVNEKAKKVDCGCGKACSNMHKGDCYKCCNSIHPTGWSSKDEGKIKEAEMSVGEENTSFKIRVDVSNKQSETKLGIRIQLTPKEGMLEPDVRDKVEIAISKKLNNALEQFDMQVSKDTDVPDPAVIGFFIPISQIKNMIVKSIKGGATPPPTGGTPPPPKPTAPAKPPTPAAPAAPATPAKPETTNEMIANMINEALLEEMRVRDLKEISGVVLKEDFYSFINAGNNVLRTLEENGIDRGKKYLEYLVKHNIM